MYGKRHTLPFADTTLALVLTLPNPSPLSPKSGIVLGSCLIFTSMLGVSLTFPFLQAQRDLLGCDALCYSTMNSALSGLGLLESMFVGRLGDTLGCKSALFLGTASSVRIRLYFAFIASSSPSP